jgi:hypothetical protein
LRELPLTHQRLSSATLRASYSELVAIGAILLDRTVAARKLLLLDACSVDPTTGNLAVANYPGNVVVFENGSGAATDYSVSTPYYLFFVAYDNAGICSLTATA